MTKSTSRSSSWALVSSTVRRYSAARPTWVMSPKRRSWASWAKEVSEKSGKSSGMSGMILAAASRYWR